MSLKLEVCVNSQRAKRETCEPAPVGSSWPQSRAAETNMAAFVCRLISFEARRGAATSCRFSLRGAQH